ncbi:Transporter of the ATP-binding cassette (ABC) [Microbotryomycetes sp. JL221]|nr:Transporter of the ATP-binding cassette (ABC) [Microbotryomycetes sp. JL221]
MSAHEQFRFSIVGASSGPSSTPRDVWCRRDDQPLWDGLDFSQCFRARALNGIIPLVYATLSIAVLLIAILVSVINLVRRRRRQQSTQPKRRLSRSSARSRAHSISRTGPRAIAEAENEVILSVVADQSPDLNGQAMRSLAGAAIGAVFEAEDEDVPSRSFSIRLILRSLLGCKLDIANVAGSAALLALSVAEWHRQRRLVGGAWTIAQVVAWALTLVLVIVRLAISFHRRMSALSRPGAGYRPPTSAYQLVECIVIPWYGLYTTIKLFDLRSALLHGDKAAKPLCIATLIVGVVLFSSELFAPRPSQFASRSNKASTAHDSTLPKQPELHASLFSLITFSFMEGFMFRSAFPKLLRVPKLTMDTVPDLRPDDKTARVLLTYRRDMISASRWFPTFKTNSNLSLKLMWHFRRELMMQQGWTYVKIAFVNLPALFMQALLKDVSKRARGEYAPVHVSFLYACGMAATQIIASLAGSQALYIGRRLCIRLRSIMIGEVFTKALRRRDGAGSSASKASTESEQATKDKLGEDATGNRTEDQELSELEEDLEHASSGKIVNLISVDTFRASEVSAYLHQLWPDTLVTLVVTLCLLYRVLGWSSFAGVAVIVLLTPVQGFIAKSFSKYQTRLLAAADARLSLATEVIAAVRIVKYFAWEDKFLAKMNEARKKELRALWYRALTIVFGGALSFAAPALIAVATFVVHTKVRKLELTAETAFTALALFNVLRHPLEMFTDMFVFALEAYISLKRVGKFLDEPESAKYAVVKIPAAASDPIVGLVNGVFTWVDKDAAMADNTLFRLRDINLTFPQGKLSIVLGPVGSGKSTLLLSLLGETNCLSGSAFLPSPVVRATGENPAVLTETSAYAAQSPWLLSDTIKQNIVFGSELNEERYQDVLDACALRPDLKQFELGDETEVGEKGTVLSGGQKARISLARAIYSPAKYVLLDDVLSAVDAHTAGHLVEHCLIGPIMRHRTCILVTHAVDLCLPVASFVVSMDNGTIVSSGSPTSLALDKDLSSSATTAVSSVSKGTETLQVASQDKKTRRPSVSVNPSESQITIEAVAEGCTDQEAIDKRAEERRAMQEKLKLIKDETQSEGAVSWDVYRMYFAAMGGWKWVATAFAIFALAQMVDVYVQVALRYWANSYENKRSVSMLVVQGAQHAANRIRHAPATFVQNLRASGSDSTASGHSHDYWLKLYCLLAAVSCFTSSLRFGFWLYRGVVASRILYHDLIQRVLTAPIRFFDTTPTGRILNRLSKDMETLDQDVASTLMWFILEISMVVGIIGTISIVLPGFLIAAFFLSIAYTVIGYLYLASSRELKRSESVTKSPIYSVFGETINGVTTIRAYGDSARFTKDIFKLVDTNNRPFFALWQGNRWLSVRVDVAGAMVAFAAAVFVLIAKVNDPALAGFVVSFAITFTDRMLWVVRLYSQNEVNANSVERIREYMTLDQESTGGIMPPAAWPSREGQIRVENLTCSYAPELAPVLKNLSFTVNPREKIGIVGRTGSGKSTLGLSFFRFIEPSSGRIVIDGHDIGQLKLSELRSRLTIVAQESALFAGTLRFNLDPFDQFEDSDIWDALRRVQMASPLTPSQTPRASRPASVNGSATASSSTTTVEEGTTVNEGDEVEDNDRFVIKSLDMLVTESGKNFSQGQRQLLSLARGLLKLKHGGSNILILDESTASLDSSTDESIQRTIRDEMQEAIILCIAHRLQTVVDFDKILVLGQGEKLEFDTPWSLLRDESSVFYELAQKSGDFDELKRMAEAKRDRDLKA